MARIKELVQETIMQATYSLEGLQLLGLESASTPAEHEVFVLLTDTKTLVSKISKWVTAQPYNHVSLMLTPDFDDGIYTFSLGNGVNGLRGGFMVEDRENLKGSHYSLYRMAVSAEVHEKIRTRVEDYVKGIQSTSYNHLGLFNAIFQKNIFASDDGQASICSEFVVEVLNFSGVELFAKRASSTIRPYDLIKSKLLKFYKRGVIR